MILDHWSSNFPKKFSKVSLLPIKIFQSSNDFKSFLICLELSECVHKSFLKLNDSTKSSRSYNNSTKFFNHTTKFPQPLKLLGAFMEPLDSRNVSTNLPRTSNKSRNFLELFRALCAFQPFNNFISFFFNLTAVLY